jgi:D-sedoheptulose 7-phosphate isomerase
MRDSILKKTEEHRALVLCFMEESAERLEACCRALALRFQEGGRLFVMGNGGSPCDAQHVAVEFQHPIVEKRRPLPALSLTSDTAWMTAVGNDSDFSLIFVGQLAQHATRKDAVLGISTSGASANVTRALRHARAEGLLTIGFGGRDGGAMVDLCDYPFIVPSWATHRIQETHTLLLHLLWDHVHVALGEDDVL